MDYLLSVFSSRPFIVATAVGALCLIAKYYTSAKSWRQAARKKAEDGSPLRIGVVGAAKIAPSALIKPALQLSPLVLVSAVASRSKARAESYAKKHGIRKAYGSYSALFADESVDAVYIATPNFNHAELTMEALRAGKHVLCEKPMTSNEEEAKAVAAVVAETGLVCMEAFHYRWHPAMTRLRAMLKQLGAIRSVTASLAFPGWLTFGYADIRFNSALAGGAWMDVGCYLTSLARLLCGDEPSAVSATATPLQADASVDVAMQTQLTFPSGATAHLFGSMNVWLLPSVSVTVQAEHGSASLFNWILPHFYHRLTFERNGETWTESVPDTGKSTYYFQLRAFVKAVASGTVEQCDIADSVRNMAAIDAAYIAAGMRPRCEK